jgi:hypothetical protein
LTPVNPRRSLETSNGGSSGTRDRRISIVAAARTDRDGCPSLPSMRSDGPSVADTSGPDLSLTLPSRTSIETVRALTADLETLQEVEQTTTSDRSFLGAALVLVKVAGPALESAATALPLIQKIVELVRGRGVSGASIELADGTKISVDSASAADIERLLEAAKRL